MLFLQAVSAVIAGNLLCFGWFYFAWRVTKQEKQTGSHEGLPVWVYALGAIPPLVAAAGVYTLPG